MVIKIQFNTLSDTMIMILLDHLCIRLPQMTWYARKFDENATLSFIVKDKKVL